MRETDDVQLLPRTQHWAQFVDENGALHCVDRPATIVGSQAQESTGRCP
jgi:hypothetical protein